MSDERNQTRTERRYSGETIVTEWAPTGNEEQPWRLIGASTYDFRDRLIKRTKPEELAP